MRFRKIKEQYPIFEEDEKNNELKDEEVEAFEKRMSTGLKKVLGGVLTFVGDGKLTTKNHYNYYYSIEAKFNPAKEKLLALMIKKDVSLCYFGSISKEFIISALNSSKFELPITLSFELKDGGSNGMGIGKIKF